MQMFSSDLKISPLFKKCYGNQTDCKISVEEIFLMMLLVPIFDSEIQEGLSKRAPSFFYGVVF